MSHASPSLASRQPPPPGGQGPQQQGGAGPIPGGSREDAVNSDIMLIPQSTLNVLKQELGLGDKDLPSLSMNEKVRVFFFDLFWELRFAGLIDFFHTCPFFVHSTHVRCVSFLPFSL